MKVRLIKKFYNMIEKKWKYHFLLRDISGKHLLARNLWYKKFKGFPKLDFVDEFKYKYRRYSRKYWTAEARMRRVLLGEMD